MSLKGSILDSKLYSIFGNKCPHCHKGRFFKVNNPYNFKDFDKMHKNCEICDEDFEREVGFYYGAMYTSYGLNVVWFVAIWVALNVLSLDDMSIGWMAAVMIGISLSLMPVTYRLARLIWINLFVKYDKAAASRGNVT